jgi:hypothetical protein
MSLDDLFGDVVIADAASAQFAPSGIDQRVATAASDDLVGSLFADDIAAARTSAAPASRRDAGSRHASAFAAARDARRADRDLIAAQRLAAVAEVEGDDVELRRKDRDIGVFRTRSYAAAAHVAGEQLAAPREQIPIVTVTRSAAPRQATSGGASETASGDAAATNAAASESDDQLLERLSRALADAKRIRREERARRRESAADLAAAADTFRRAQAARAAELARFVQ